MKKIRNHVLSYLQNNREGFVSGEAISQNLGISRAGVWKHVQSLRRQGFMIEASSRCGYRLIAVPEKLNPDEIKKGYENHPFFRNLIYYPAVDSTNREAHKTAEKGAPEGTVILADEQTHGRGRKGRSWFSPPGRGLWLSVILRPQGIPPEKMSPLTAVTAAATASGLRKLTGENISVKWPNDLFLNGRKTGGILAELKAEPEQIHHIILGIGININHAAGDFPGELTNTATSLQMETGRQINRNETCRIILLKLASAYNTFLQEGFSPFRELWKEHNITLDRQVTVHYGEKRMNGLALDIDHEGALIIEDARKEKHRFTYGEVGS